MIDMKATAGKFLVNPQLKIWHSFQSQAQRYEQKGM